MIAVGGGGIPVADMGEGEYRGVAAVIDKDYAASLLARGLKADLFVISTAVEKVAINFGKPDQEWLDRITLSQAKAYLAEGKAFCQRIDGPQNPGLHLVPGKWRKRSVDHQSLKTSAAPSEVKPARASFSIERNNKGVSST